MSVLQSYVMINFLILQLMKVTYSLFTWQEKKDSSEIQPVVQERVHKVLIFSFILNITISLLWYFGALCDDPATCLSFLAGPNKKCKYVLDKSSAWSGALGSGMRLCSRSSTLPVPGSSALGGR